MEFIQEGKELFQSHWKATLIMIRYLLTLSRYNMIELNKESGLWLNDHMQHKRILQVRKME